ncbi:hypothetical protein, partial [Enterobacter hormaechei]|uniref:hypothetical protein n=1 Tax=Enterobacter hormaechei TaxID=158836 RepID=UPI003D6E34E2
SAEFTIGEGELMAHDVPLGCAPDEYDDLISGTCSHLPFHPGTLKPVTRIKSQGHTVNDAGNSVITLYTALSHYRAAITG